ncbi:hypothetical protein AXG93_2675s1120 [Marchantia polymorpha subsp. ruderalis]|uniref:Uncharacterized protein n=1 Tax=Marchantia polymorpha subsp. ruderalis TaxID=1480154 RepID=A0A176VP38_MARPO|nr:hypothetical protein AXG93_2675s1120 [Marchantia polymorpha subsp. ruderalis]
MPRRPARSRRQAASGAGVALVARAVAAATLVPVLLAGGVPPTAARGSTLVHAGAPLLLSEQQLAAARVFLLILVVVLVTHLETTRELLDRHGAEIEQALDGAGHLLVLLGDDAQVLEDDHLVVDGIAENLKLLDQLLQAHPEVVDALTRLEPDGLVLLAQHLGLGLAYAFGADADRLDCVPGLLCRLLDSEHGDHLLGHRLHFRAIVVVLGFSCFNHIPQMSHLKDHAHEERPRVVVGAAAASPCVLGSEPSPAPFGIAPLPIAT